MLSLVVSLLTLLATVLPVILQNMGEKKLDGEEVRKKLVERDLSKLRDDLERVRARKARHVVSQR